MEFAWNTQKNKITDIKGLELEQERKGKITNKEIDLSRTDLNYDLVKSNINLYNRIKNRVEAVRSVSRVQKNSVVDYSNIITIPRDEANKWGIEESKRYFKEVYNYFCNEFGKENVVSAKVHLDETSPHMHLHFVPVSAEGKLQARKVMTPGRINKIHTEAPKYLREKGFEIERGQGKTEKSLEIKKFKEKKIEENINSLKDELKLLTEIKKEISNLNKIEYKKNFIGGKISIKEEDFKDLKNNLVNLKEENLKLKSINNKISEELKEVKEKYKIEKENFDNALININQKEETLGKINTQMKYYKYTCSLIWSTIKKDLKVNDFVIDEILKSIKNENEIEKEKIIKENKISEKFLEKLDDIKIKIDLKNIDNNLKNIFQKENYSLKEIEEIFESFAFMKTKKIDINICLESRKKILNLKNLKLDFENKSLKNQLLKNKNIIKQLELEFKSQDKILNNKNTIKNSMGFEL